MIPDSGKPGGSGSDTGRNVTLGMAALLAETFMLMVIATVAKLFAADISIQVFLLFRYVFSLPLLFSINIWQSGSKALSVTNVQALVLRSVFGLIALTAWLFAISLIEITKATAIAQSLPVFITLLAPIILGERVGIRRWLAVVAGLAGTLILIRPDAHGWLQPGIGYAIAAPFFAALMYIFLRKLGASDAPAKTASIYNLFGAVVFTIWCLLGDFDWPRTSAEFGILAACGVLGSLQQWLIAASHKLAPASTLAPLHYATIPMAIASGVILFGEPITASFLAGTTILVASTYYIFIRERRLGGGG